MDNEKATIELSHIFYIQTKEFAFIWRIYLWCCPITFKMCFVGPNNLKPITSLRPTTVKLNALQFLGHVMTSSNDCILTAVIELETNNNY